MASCQEISCPSPLLVYLYCLSIHLIFSAYLFIDAAARGEHWAASGSDTWLHLSAQMVEMTQWW